MKQLLLGIAIILGLTVQAWAETPSKTCVANIVAANSKKYRGPPVPSDCWRLGSIKLGMTMLQTRTYLGTPGASSDFTLTYRRRKVAVTRQLYVYPRNLRNWLKLAPAAQKDFHPVTLKLDFSDGKLVAIGLDTEARVTPPPCRPSAAGRAYVRGGMDFPYGLHGMTLGAPINSVTDRFGKFAGGNKTQDFTSIGRCRCRWMARTRSRVSAWPWDRRLKAVGPRPISSLPWMRAAASSPATF